MSRILDKYTYVTTYKQDYCCTHLLPRGVNKNSYFVEPPPGPSRVPTSRRAYPCQLDSSIPLKKVVAVSPPKNVKPNCFGFPPRENRYLEELRYNERKDYYNNNYNEQCRAQFERSKTPELVKKPSPPECFPYRPLRPLPRGRFGGQYEGVLNMPPGREDDQGHPEQGPPWQRVRPDERRDPDVLRLRRHPPRGDARDVIHGEEARGAAARGGRGNYELETPIIGGARRRVSQSQSEVRIPGPFWTRRRPDERREIDVPRRRKFETPSEIRGVIHGEGRFDTSRRSSYGSSGAAYPTRRAPPSSSMTRIPGPFWLHEGRNVRREIDVPRRRKFSITSEIKDVIHGGEQRSYDLPSRCRPSSGSRIPGPFWMVQRPDERREPDIGRRRRIERPGEISDVIHGEDARQREWQEARDRRRQGHPVNLYDLPPGPSHADPFWLLERPDERRDPDMDRKRKFRRKKIEAAEIIHGEDFRTRWDPPEEAAAYPEPPPPREEPTDSEDSEDEEWEVRRCGPAPGMDYELGPPRGWRMDYEDMADMDMAEWEHPRPYRRYDIAPDVEEVLRRPPAARVSCAPLAEPSTFDQPNAFMRKLYQKYPYLYQVLTDTPPEELISRVFKDRFLSTYQVDYLHMGVGRINEEATGADERGRRYAGPDGEPEPEMIPGCSYRHSQKGNFGRKKHKKLNEKEEREEKEKERERERDRDKDEPPPPQEERDEPSISEYMATISRLGNDIMQDRLYRVAEVTRNMKNQYKKL